MCKQIPQARQLAFKQMKIAERLGDAHLMRSCKLHLVYNDIQVQRLSMCSTTKKTLAITCSSRCRRTQMGFFSEASTRLASLLQDVEDASVRVDAIVVSISVLRCAHQTPPPRLHSRHTTTGGVCGRSVCCAHLLAQSLQPLCHWPAARGAPAATTRRLLQAAPCRAPSIGPQLFHAHHCRQPH